MFHLFCWHLWFVDTSPLAGLWSIGPKNQHEWLLVVDTLSASGREQVDTFTHKHFLNQGIERTITKPGFFGFSLGVSWGFRFTTSWLGSESLGAEGIFWRGDGTGKIGCKWVPLRKEGMWFVRVRRANVICHVTMQRCCFVWVFFVWNSRLRSKSTPGPRQQLGTMSFLSLLRWKKTHIPNLLFWKTMDQMETHPMAKRRGQASVQLFGDYDL